MWNNSIQEINLKDSCWSWVAYPKSLTKFLKQQAGHEDLVIRLLEQSWRSPSYEESLRLSIINDNKILERKIVMVVMNRPWLFARTIFTKQASDLLGDNLRNLSSNSLGELIDKFYPLITRGSFEYSLLDKTNPIYKDIINTLLSNNYSLDTANYIIRNKLVIRRSIFFYNDSVDKTALFNIDEVFLPALVNKMLNLEVVA